MKKEYEEAEYQDYKFNSDEEKEKGSGCWWVLLVIAFVWIGVGKVIEFFSQN